jgi:sulfate/thiosulfate transport system substrate-binding protein
VILRHRSTALLVILALLATMLTLVAAGCGGDDSSASSDTAGGSGGGGSELTIVGYSVAREVNADLITAFQATPDGQGVSFKESYAASGEQSRAVEAGQKADYVVFSLEPDMTRLVDAGLVDKDWDAGPHKGMVSDSVVVFITRKGNPKGITTWNDLTKDGVDVITPNPFTSGAAQWNIIAAYQSQIDQGKTHDEALAYLDALFKNVPVQPASGREALQVFDSGQGDVLLSYENEAIAAQQAGVDIDYVVPDQNLLIENPAAVVNSGNVRKAQAYLDFVLSPEGQKIFGDHGYRPVDRSVAAQFDFPTPSDLSTIADLGGWAKVKSEFFDPENGSITKIFEGQGIATE